MTLGGEMASTAVEGLDKHTVGARKSHANLNGNKKMAFAA